MPRDSFFQNNNYNTTQADAGGHNDLMIDTFDQADTYDQAAYPNMNSFIDQEVAVNYQDDHAQPNDFHDNQFDYMPTDQAANELQELE